MNKLIALPIALLIASIITGSVLAPPQIAPATHEPTQDIAAAAPIIGPVSPPPEARLDTTVTVHNAGADQTAAIDDALARFHNNGLDLPDIDIWFSNDSADCKGHYGLFQPRVEPKRITVCSNYDFVLTHELAHAWIHAHIDTDTIVRYLELRGKSTWDDHDQAWADRGLEDAAFVIQQNLTRTSPAHATDERTSRTAAFELLTGQRSPLLPLLPVVTQPRVATTAWQPHQMPGSNNCQEPEDIQQCQLGLPGGP